MSMTPTIVALISIVIGLLICFTGYRLFRFYLMIAGFILGFNTVMTFGAGGMDYNNIPVLIVAVIVGIVVALLSWVLYRFGVAIAGGFLGWAVASNLVLSLGLTDIAAAAVMVVCIIIGVLIAFAITDLIIMISTAIGGAQIATGGIAALPITGITLAGPLLIIIMLLLAVFGFVAQWSSGGRTRRAII